MTVSGSISYFSLLLVPVKTVEPLLPCPGVVSPLCLGGIKESLDESLTLLTSCRYVQGLRKPWPSQGVEPSVFPRADGGPEALRGCRAWTQLSFSSLQSQHLTWLM